MEAQNDGQAGRYDGEFYQGVLEKFQCEKNREIEESFARAFSESDEARLFFINGDAAYTDGKTIVVDPAFCDIYKDDGCLKKTEEVLGWPNLVSGSAWNALKMVTRGLTLHECLHLLYTNLPGNQFADPDFAGKRNARKVVSSISNIIEDAYIEAVGASVYDNIAIYLMFNRVASVFAKKEVEGTAERKFKMREPDEIKNFSPPASPSEEEKLSSEEKKLLETYLRFVEAQKKTQRLVAYLDYMADFLLLPMFEFKEPGEDIAEYVEKTKRLFLDGSVQDNPDARYAYCKKIYEIIKPLVPEDFEAELEQNLLPDFVGGQESHGENRNSIGGKKIKGRTQKVATRLFANLDGTKKNNVNTDVRALIAATSDFKIDEEACDKIVFYDGYKVRLSGNSVGAPPLHNEITINENHPKINLHLKKAYQNLYNHYRLNINSYNARFLHMLKANVPVKENHFLFGAGIDSKTMGDVKRRFWFRIQRAREIPDLAILLLIDGSGSMDGERRNSAICAGMILHEVLKKQGIAHAIVEHRSFGYEPEIEANVLVDFNSREEEKLNILQLAAGGDNRDGLALYWAEKYINKKTFCDNKLIIVLSDGLPNHAYDEYYGAVADKDTQNAAKKIIGRGTNVIAVALDDFDCGEDDSTYSQLKEIYPQLVQCKDLTRLTGQILRIVSRQFA